MKAYVPITQLWQLPAYGNSCSIYILHTFSPLLSYFNANPHVLLKDIFFREKETYNSLPQVLPLLANWPPSLSLIFQMQTDLCDPITWLGPWLVSGNPVLQALIPVALKPENDPSQWPWTGWCCLAGSSPAVGHLICSWPFALIMLSLCIWVIFGMPPPLKTRSGHL